MWTRNDWWRGWSECFIKDAGHCTSNLLRCCPIAYWQPAQPAIGKYKTIAINHFAHFNIEGLSEHRPIENKGMELPVFPARIDVGWQAVQQLRRQFATGKLCRQHPWIDTGETGTQTTREHFSQQLPRWYPPQWKHRLDTGALQALLAVTAHILQTNRRTPCNAPRRCWLAPTKSAITAAYCSSEQG